MERLSEFVSKRREAMRLKVLLVLAFVAMTAVTVQAQQITGFVESWNNMSDAGVKPQLNVLLNGPIKGDVGWTAWTLTSKGWGEALVGLTYKPAKAKWLEVSGSVGLEHAVREESSLRFGASVFAKRGRLSFLSIREEGVEHWYRHLGKLQVTETLAIGVESRRFFGTGLYAEKKLSKKVSLWGTYAGDKGVMSARLSF